MAKLRERRTALRSRDHEAEAVRGAITAKLLRKADPKSRKLFPLYSLLVRHDRNRLPDCAPRHHLSQKLRRSLSWDQEAEMTSTIVSRAMPTGGDVSMHF